ncbi:MAG TPA: ankyrin repeat domain-containing protein, partial [Acidobacteriota bacterium]|nr:ankyrin repeat domain-containing protein [Acidobacteriota bacterium]
ALCQSHGWTPLHLAARRGSREIVEMLIRKGADATVADFDGSTPLHLAQRANHQDALGLLRHPERIGRDHSTSRRTYDAKGDPYVAPDLGAFATMAREQVVGASHRDLDAVRETLRTYPQLAHAVATTTEGTVEAGAHMGRRDMVALLLDHGAPYSLPTAVMRNDATGVAHLLDEDPDRIRERGAHDFPLLWYPIIGRTGPDMLEELLRRGAKVEQQHYLGTTALHFAAARDQAEMAEVLIAHGADVNRAGRKFSADGHTPLDLAGPKTTPLLRSHGAKPGKG